MQYLMEIKQHFRLSRLKIALLSFFYLSLFHAQSQVWEEEDSISVPYQIASFAIDQEGKIYLGSVEGDIYRYDENGKEDKLFSGINYSKASIIEPWNRLKLFIFYRENQLIVYMDRFITSPTEYLLNELNVGFVNLATPGVDNSFWLVESSFNELRKYKEKELIFNTPLKNIDTREATHIRAYQNLLILLNPQFGFYFFDQFGNSLTELPLKGCEYFHISNGTVLTYNGNEVISFDPNQPFQMQKAKAPEGNYKGVLKMDKSYYFILQQGIVKYSLN